MASRRGGPAVKKDFSAVSTGVMQKNNFTNLSDTGFNSSQ